MSETSTYRNIIYRLLPGSRANARRLAGQAGACRFVWKTKLDIWLNMLYSWL